MQCAGCHLTSQRGSLGPTKDEERNSFKSGGFSGPKGVWAAVQNGIGQVSSWLAQGAWMVP